MTSMRSILLATAAAMVATTSYAADQQLSGSISTAAGQKLDGVTVSAKMVGGTITTSVYTDADGNYYFPPMAAGKYKVWAQALGFERNDATRRSVGQQAPEHRAQDDHRCGNPLETASGRIGDGRLSLRTTPKTCT